VSVPEEPPLLGQLLRQHRVAAGLTQSDLAERAGLSVRGISDLERGVRRAAHPHTVRQLAVALALGEQETARLMAAARGEDVSGSADELRAVDSNDAGAQSSGGSALPDWDRITRQRRVMLTGGAVIFLALAAGLGTQLWPLATGAPTPTPASPTSAAVAAEAGQVPLVNDSLADPSNGAFPRLGAAATTATFTDGSSATYQWDYAYMYSAIVAHVLGPYPANPDGAWLGAGATLDQPLPRNFAMQVRGRITRSAEDSAFGLAYQTDSRVYAFEVTPVDQGYRLWRDEGQTLLAEGHTSYLLPPSQPNLVRVEIRGDTLVALTNGHEVARTGPSDLGARQGGNVSLRWAMTGPPAEGGSIEVRFAQFALYALP
jgi:transcriptional regulator with XRE-family HTH domain